MDSKQSYLKFDLASQSDSTPSEDDDHIRKEMQLSANQILVSKIYKLHWREDVGDTTTDVIVPVDIPEANRPDTRKSCLYFLLRQNAVWRKEEADNPVDGRVHGQLNKVDAFALILEYDDTTHDARVENMTIGPEGGKFISKKDERITMNFPQGALDENVDFQFKAALIDKERYVEYQKLSPDFKCVHGFTHTLGISPEVTLKRPAQVCLPLDMQTKGGNSEVLFLHWKKDDEGRKVAHVADELPTAEPDNCYSTSIGVSTSSAYAPVCVPKKAPKETVATSVDFLCGRKSICNILTFINYDRKYKMYRLLVDCVDFYKVDSVIELHKLDGMVEVEKSRSRDIEMKKKARIKISLEGSLTFFDKSVRVTSILYDYYARTNKVLIPVTSMGGSMSIVRYSWDKENHQVFFFLDTKQSKRPAKPKPNTASRDQFFDSSSTRRKMHESSKSRYSLRNDHANDLQDQTNLDQTEMNIHKSGKPMHSNYRNGCNMKDSKTEKVTHSRKSDRSGDSGINKATRVSSGPSISVREKDLVGNKQISNNRNTRDKDNVPRDEPHTQAPSSDVPNGFELSGFPSILTDKSLSALSDSLPLSVWRSVGFELNFTHDHITTLLEEAERIKSDSRFHLLREWRTRGSSLDSETLMQELINALTQIGRNDVVEILHVVQLQNREIRRSDFGRSPATVPKQKASLQTHKKRAGEFLYPDGI